MPLQLLFQNILTIHKWGPHTCGFRQPPFQSFLSLSHSHGSLLPLRRHRDRNTEQVCLPGVRRAALNHSSRPRISNSSRAESPPNPFQVRPNATTMPGRSEPGGGDDDGMGTEGESRRHTCLCYDTIKPVLISHCDHERSNSKSQTSSVLEVGLGDVERAGGRGRPWRGEARRRACP